MASTPSGSTTPIAQRVSTVIEFLVRWIAISVPIFYGLGRMYVEAYWGALKVPISLIRLSADDYLYTGFMMIMVALARSVGANIYGSMGYALAIAAGIALLAIVMMLVDRYLFGAIRRQAGKLRTKIEVWRTSQLKHVVDLGLTGTAVWSLLVMVLLGLLLAFLLFVLPIQLAVNQGKAEAEKVRTALSTNPEDFATATFERNQQVESGAFVECGQSWCVVFSNKIFVVTPVDSVRVVDAPKPIIDKPKAN